MSWRQVYVTPPDEAAPDSVTRVPRTTPVWSEPAFATTALCGVTGPNGAEAGPQPVLASLFALTVNHNGASPSAR